ncbi:hypothetical protein RvY_17191-1 [Ramazzottius varieornatus]|uniref:Peptidase M12B domain-containing protein n=1 Tax=Ramazzottius varieornatus TaxID=947166 RepID=A0A1D1W199_RAMVA|nr:hypothetical protein RvY_17191-1 [Ramazzottius varieornatus]
MTIVADHRFFQNVGFGSVHKTLEAIVWHIEEVDHLYRQADWNNDKAPDRIGVSLDKVIIFTDAASPGNAFKDETTDDEVFLKRFAGVNTTGSCVAAVFTFSDLGGTFGISYVGTVCAPKYNWALINFRNVDGEIRQRAASVITIMHEVAHVFGANHDENETRCLPAGQNNGADNGGNYIMYPTSAFGLYENNHRFSPCSVESIAKNFQDAKRTRCMIDRSPTAAPSRRRRATKRDVFRYSVRQNKPLKMGVWSQMVKANEIFAYSKT